MSDLSIIVIDDFYKNAGEVRRMAISSEYTKFSDGPYQYSEASPPATLIKAAVKRISSVIGEKYRGKFINSRFISETREDERISKQHSWVHFDRCRWVGVLYLSLPEHCEGGTSFFRHKKTGFGRWEELLDYTISGRGRPRDVFDDSTDLSKWDVVSSVGMKFNRLLLFDSRMFHQATSYFGTNLYDSRLYQHFAFDERSDDKLIRKLKRKEKNNGQKSYVRQKAR